MVSDTVPDMTQNSNFDAAMRYVLSCLVAGAIGIAGCDASSRPMSPAISNEDTGDITEQVCNIVAKQMAVDRSSVNPGTSLGDLNADELDFVELVMELEDHFQISIPDDAFAGATRNENWQEGKKKVTVASLIEVVNARRKQRLAGTGSKSSPVPPTSGDGAK
jgi:acyl carrier protein